MDKTFWRIHKAPNAKIWGLWSCPCNQFPNGRDGEELSSVIASFKKRIQEPQIKLMMASSHQTGRSTSLQTLQVSHLTDMRCWECHRHSRAAEVAVLFYSEFVHEGLLHKTAALGKIFWFTNSKNSVLGKYHQIFMLRRWGHLPLAAVGDTGLVQPGCSSAWIEAAFSSAETPLKEHRIFDQKDQSTCCIFISVLQQPKARLLPTAVMGTEIHSALPLSTQILAAYVIPEQIFSFPIRSWISPWQPHTLSGLSRIPPGLLLPMHTHPAESLGFFWVVLTSVESERNNWCCFMENELSVIQPQDAEQEKCS